MARDYTDTPVHLAAHLSRLFNQAFQTRFAPHGVSPAQFPVLLHLWRADGLTQHELCDLVGIEQPTMANTLKRMERDGLVRKVQDDNDRRKVRIRLTRKAVNLQDTLTRSANEVLGTAWAGFTPRGRDAFSTLVGRMVFNLEQDLNQDPLILEQEMSQGEPTSEPSFPSPPDPDPTPTIEPEPDHVFDEPEPEPEPQQEPEPEPESQVFGSGMSMPGMAPEPQSPEPEPSQPDPMSPGSLWPDTDEDLEPEPITDTEPEQEQEPGPTPEFPYDTASPEPREHKPRPSDDESELLILEEIYEAPGEEDYAMPEPSEDSVGLDTSKREDKDRSEPD